MSGRQPGAAGVCFGRSLCAASGTAADEVMTAPASAAGQLNVVGGLPRAPAAHARAAEPQHSRLIHKPASRLWDGKHWLFGAFSPSTLVTDATRSHKRSRRVWVSVANVWSLTLTRRDGHFSSRQSSRVIVKQEAFPLGGGGGVHRSTPDHVGDALAW